MTSKSPCPFCRERRALRVHEFHGQTDAGRCDACGQRILERWTVWVVTCSGCGARGPDGDSREDAIEIWNERAAE